MSDSLRVSRRRSNVRALKMLSAVAHARDEQGTTSPSSVAAVTGGTWRHSRAGSIRGSRRSTLSSSNSVRTRRPDRLTLVASGWIYPTDSSINVAIGQGGAVKPKRRGAGGAGSPGHWRVVECGPGFPAGKNKTMLIDLREVTDATRLRLRTNLEIYWDALIVASEVPVPLRTKRLDVRDAELRYRGYSETTSLRGDAPETPNYERKSGVTQRWRDLTGYHTGSGV